MNRPAVLVIAAVVVVLVVALVIAPQDDADRTGPMALDQRASALIEQLGSLCRHFDFQFKEEVGDGEVRPVWCSGVPAAGDGHPEFVLFVFSDASTKSQWVRSDGPTKQELIEGALGSRVETREVEGDDWIAVSDLPRLDEVKARLDG